MPLLWGSPEHSLTSPILPVDTSSSRGSRRSSNSFCCRTALFTLLVTVILAGIFLTCVLSIFGGLPLGTLLSVLPFGRARPPPRIWVDSSVFLPPPTSPELEHEDGYLQLEELRNLVSQTKGFFARDYSLYLGWNNLRYIIEAAILHAQILNRTLVLPSFVYARSCEYDTKACASYAPMFNKNNVFGWNEWQDLPIDQQMTWRIPITTMFNLTHLRRTHPVILISDYLRLHNLPADTEGSNGAWLQFEYHTHANVFESNPQRRPSLQVIENKWYEDGINRVDVLPLEMRIRGNWSDNGGDPSRGENGSWGHNITTTISSSLHVALPKDKSVLSWEAARKVLEAVASKGGEINDVPSTDEGLEKLLQVNGWEVLYTYMGPLDMEWTKNVAQPIRQVAPRWSLRGLKEDFGELTADVVLLSGEVHLGRKPGALRFTSSSEREKFSRLVLHQLHPVDKVLDLANRLDERMSELNGGRMWMAAHMRRTDFARYGWTMETTIQDHLERVRKRLMNGRNILRSLRELSMKSYEVPDVVVDHSILHLHPPKEHDKFFVATDERDPNSLTYLTNNGVVLIQDLLTFEDRRKFGWPLMMSDVVAILEQATLARAAYFYGHAMSSVAGGVINMRAARGADSTTALLD